MTRDEALRVLAVLIAAYPTITLTRESIAIYADAISDLAFADAMLGTKKLIRTNKYFPSIAELREATRNTHRMDGDSAWALVLDEIRRVGAQRIPALPPDVKQAVKAIGGWATLCHSERINVDRTAFLRVYERYMPDSNEVKQLGSSS